MEEPKQTVPALAAVDPIPKTANQMRKIIQTVENGNLFEEEMSSGATPEAEQVYLGLEKLKRSLHKHGKPPSDQEQTNWGLVLCNIACLSLNANARVFDVTLSALLLLKALRVMQMLIGDETWIRDSVKSALFFYGHDTRVLFEGRNLLQPLGCLSMDTQSRVNLLQELEKATKFQKDGAGVSPVHLVADCLQAVMNNACWAVMDPDEQSYFQTPVTAFAVWCMTNFASYSSGNSHVGMKGVMVMYHMAAGCMQVDNEHFFEDDRCSLNKLDLTTLLLMVVADSDYHHSKIKWLLDRLKTPATVAKKRTRAEVESAWERA